MLQAQPSSHSPHDHDEVGDITRYIRLSADGDSDAQQRLFSAVYTELRRLAQHALRNARNSHTLQPTALVHEAAMKLLKRDAIAELSDRRALYALAAHTMRNILVDYARRRLAGKRPLGNGRARKPFDDLLALFEERERISVLALEEALERLQSRSPRQHEIVILHFYGGLRFPEISAHLGVSLSTVEKDWKFARCWLLGQMA